MKRRLAKRYGRSKRSRSIAHVIGAKITHYGDTGQIVASVRWQDASGKEGTTEGSPNNPHMQALLDRAIRGGVRVKHETAGRVYGPHGSHVVPANEIVPARFR